MAVLREVLRLLRVEVRWVTCSRHEGAARGLFTSFLWSDQGFFFQAGLVAVVPLLFSATCGTGAF